MQRNDNKNRVRFVWKVNQSRFAAKRKKLIDKDIEQDNEKRSFLMPKYIRINILIQRTGNQSQLQQKK